MCGDCVGEHAEILSTPNFSVNKPFLPAFSRGHQACGWCKDRWGISRQITPRVLTNALAAGGAEAKRAFAAMMEMGKITIAKIEAARGG